MKKMMFGVAVALLCWTQNGNAQNSWRSENTSACNVTKRLASQQHHNQSRSNDVVDTAVGAGKFRTLVAAVKAAGLVSTLKGDGPFTVFAPTDEAFAKLPKGTVEELLLPENREHLVKILTYHVVPGRLTAEDVVALNGAKTVQGQRLKFGQRRNDVVVNNALVLKTDVTASNGIIHIIDSVLLPQ